MPYLTSERVSCTPSTPPPPPPGPYRLPQLPASLDPEHGHPGVRIVMPALARGAAALVAPAEVAQAARLEHAPRQPPAAGVDVQVAAGPPHHPSPPSDPSLPEPPPPRTAFPKPTRILLPDHRATCGQRRPEAWASGRPRAAGRRRSGTAAAGTRTACELVRGIRVGNGRRRSVPGPAVATVGDTSASVGITLR